jgi:ABC-type transport system involved in multi-copper enzyme maturation permease subunit
VNIALVTLAMLRQNRWTVLLLALWPVAMALILLVPHGIPDKDDVLSVLHQECFYALALISVTAASQLGNEERSRRSVFILARAVSRSKYLIAVLLNALISSLIFTLCFMLCGFLLVSESGGNYAAVIAMAIMQFLLCVWFAAFGVFFSVFLPILLATVAVSFAGGAIFLLGRHSAVFGVSRVIPDMLTIPLNMENPSAGISGIAIASIIAQSICAFLLAAFLFSHRDLHMTEN